MHFFFFFFKGLWFWSGLGECTCKVICQFFLSVFFYMHGDYAAISGTQGLIFSSQNGSSSWGKQSLNIYKWVASSYYLRNLYWQMMTNSPVWLVISYIWWSNMYCNFHDIRVTWIADVSLLGYSMNQGHMISVQIWRCLVAWIAVDAAKAVYFALFLLDSLIPTHLLFIHKHTHMHSHTGRDSA